MGGGIGFTIMMMNLVKGNRGQLKHVEKIRDKKNETHYIPNDKLKFKEVSEEELSIIKEKIRNEKKKEDIKSLIFIASFVVIMSLVIFLLYQVT